MKIYLYSYQKRSNSTKRPTPSEGTAFDCEFFDPFTVTAPTLLIDANSDVVKYNYVLVPELDNRYYFIDDWTFENGLWRATTSEDFLATWKGTILESTQYVKRSTHGADPTLEDNFYTYSLGGVITKICRPPKNEAWQIPDSPDTDYRAYVTINSLGIEHNPNNPTQNIYYNGLIKTESTVAMNTYTMKDLRTALKSQDSSKINLYDFILRAYVLPVQPASDDVVYGTSYPFSGMIYYGDEDDVRNDCSRITAEEAPKDYLKTWGTFPQVIYPNGGTFPTGKETTLCAIKDTAVRTVSWVIENPIYSEEVEMYKRSRNYQKLFLKFQPFGTIEIDPNLHLEEKNIIVKVDVALGSGDAVLYVATGGEFMPAASTNVAVQIPLAQVVTNETSYRNQQIAGWTSLIANGVGMMSGASGGGMTAQGVVGRMGNMLNALTSMSVPMQTGSQIQGQPGSAIFDSVPTLITHRYLSTPTDVDRFGGPTMRTMLLKDLAGATAPGYEVTKKGFCATTDAHIDRYDMLATERSAIEELLNGGIYFE